MRQQWLARIQLRLEHVDAEQDPDAVLDEAALADVADLLASVPDPSADIEVAHTAGMLHWERYLALDPGDDQADLAAALTLFRPVYESRPDVVPDEVRAYFDRTGPGGPCEVDEAALWANQALVLLVQARRTGDPGPLDEAVALLNRSLAATPADHPGRGTRLNNLGLALRARSEYNDVPGDADEAVRAGRDALAVTPPESEARPVRLHNLSLSLRARFLFTDARADIDEAVEAARHAVATVATGDPDRPAMLDNLAFTLRIRFERTGAGSDIDEALALGRDALAAAPADHPDRARYLSNVAVALRARFERTGSDSDIWDAVQFARDAVAATPADDSDRASLINNVAITLLSRWERGGTPADLDEAIQAARDAVAAVPAGLLLLGRGLYLSNLAIALNSRFDRAGALGDLDEAIQAARDAVAALPPDHPDHVGNLHNLGVALRTRFNHTGVGADLDEAIAAGRRAVALTPDGHIDRTLYLSNLGLMLGKRFERTHMAADIDEAVAASHDAVAAVPSSHASRAGMLTNLAAAVWARFESTGSEEDLDTAIRAVSDAIAVSSPEHADYATMLGNLAAFRQAVFDRDGTAADLDGAITAGREAIAAAPVDHPKRASWLYNLSRALRSRFERTGVRTDIDEAAAAGRDGAGTTVAPPLVRAMAARAWGQSAATAADWEQAVAGFETAVDLIGLVAARGMAQRDREHLLDELSGLGADAAACCVRAGIPGRAVELFEQGRGVLIGQALDARTDLSVLHEHHPALAERFSQLVGELDQLDETAAERRREAARLLERVIEEIRGLPDFRDFLRSPRIADLLLAAEAGPVAVVTVSEFGSYALVLTSRGLLDPISLVNLDPETVVERTNQFLAAQDGRSSRDSRERQASEAELADVLGWLWDTIAEPVLRLVGITGPAAQGGQWPRLWWCVSGHLSFLPLAAAGRHGTRDDGVPDTVMDRVVSSTTPTIRVLGHAYARKPSDRCGGVGAGGGTGSCGGGYSLAVAMPHTDDQPDLPAAVEEMAVLARHYPGEVRVLIDAEATHDAVLAALADARWAHFACHGFSDLDDPSASRLLLADHLARPLRVADVMQLRLADARLAYLSSCSTARPGARLTDEAIHIAAAFQLAGYRHVIGTLWQVADRRSAQVAEEIYRRLATPGREEHAAFAVHHTVRALRDDWTRFPSVWAGYVHAGI